MIDFEDLELAAVGIQKICSFDVDSQGNIYIWSRQSSENFIFKFDPSGKFDHAFGRSGEGPGEIGALAYLRISERDEIIISDYGRNGLILMSASGNTLNELHLPSNMDTVTLLANGKVLAWRSVFRAEEGIGELQIIFCDKDLNELAILGPTEKLPNLRKENAPDITSMTSSTLTESLSAGHPWIIREMNRQKSGEARSRSRRRTTFSIT